MVIVDGPIIRFASTDLLAQAGASYAGTVLGRTVRLDHVVRVEPSVDALRRSLDILVAAGGEVVEAAHRFPDDVCATRSSDEGWTKWMASIAVDDGLLVLAAPTAPTGQLVDHLAQRGPLVPHHIAVLVDDLVTATSSWVGNGWVSGPVVDDGDLGQVFLTDAAGNLVELIARHGEALATFTCGNVLALSAAEDDLRSRR